MMLAWRAWLAGAGALSAAVMLAGCAATSAAPQAAPAQPVRPASCVLPRQQPMLSVELYFGRDIPGQAPLSDPHWRDFTARTIAAQFPDGFTVLPVRGQWRDPATGNVSGEASFLVKIWALPAPDLGARIDAVAQAYKSRFRQQAVGVAIQQGCASFNS